MAQAGAELAVVLFTDLAASTELRSRVGEDAAERLRRLHDQVVREAIEASGGEVVKGLGDGFMATFPAAADAVSAAIRIQQGIDRVNRRGATPVPFGVRIGISAGDVSFEDGDCFGTPVIEASRLAGAAHPGAILCSDPVQWLARGRVDARFDPVGELELKGLSQTVHALELVWQSANREPLLPLPAGLVADDRFAFVGREEPLALLQSAWKEAAGGQVRLLLVSGEPGIGKTRLSAELARSVIEDGATVLFGRCDDDLGVPYQPFVEALRSLVHALPATRFEALLGTQPAELTRLVPELSRLLPGIGSPLEADPETERYRLFEAVAECLRATAEDAPTLLVLDDLHWAAKPTLLLLRHLVRTLGTTPILVVATYRDTDLARTHPLAELLADLRRVQGVERLDLGGLDEAAILEFLHRSAGHEVDRAELLAALLRQETDGNAFFLREVVLHLVEAGSIYRREGRWTSDAVSVEDLPVPEGIREVVGRRLSRLSDDTNSTLAWAAVIGPQFDLPLLAGVCELPEDRLLATLDEAQRAGLVSELPGRGVSYRFAHALVRTTLYEEVRTARRVAMHRRVAQAIEAQHPTRLDDYLPQLAHHWTEAAAAGVVDKAIDYSVRLGRVALDQKAFDEAAAALKRALDLQSLGADNGDRARCELMIELGTAEILAGDPEHRRTLLEASALAERIGDPVLQARAAVANNRDAYSEYGEVDQEKVGALERAAAALDSDDPGLRARVLTTLAWELTFAPNSEGRRIELLDEAARLGEAAGDREATFRALLGRIAVGYSRSDAELREQMTTSLWTQAVSSGDPALRALVGYFAVFSALEMGRPGDLPDIVAEVETAATALRRPFWRWLAGLGKTGWLTNAGDLEGAEAANAEAFEWGCASSSPEAEVSYLNYLRVIRREQGRLDEIRDAATEVLSHDRWTPYRALFHAELGDMDLARAEIEACLSGGVEAILVHSPWAAAAGSLAEACWMTGTDAFARDLYEQLLPCDGVVAVAAPLHAWGTAAGHLAMLADLLGDDTRCDQHFADGVDLCDRVAAPILKARTQLRWSQALARRGESERADALLREVLATAGDRGYVGLENDALARRTA